MNVRLVAVFLVLALAGALGDVSAEKPQGHPSPRGPVVGRSGIAATFGIVATSQPLAARAGVVPKTAVQQKPITWPAVNSQIGGSYPVDELEHTLMFTLESVAVASRFAAANTNVVADPGKRLLILTGSLTNIQTFTYPLGSDCVTVNVFSETAERSVSSVERSFILPGLTSFPTNLKPKEKLRFVTVVQIHAEGPIKRVAVFRGSRATRRAWYDVQKDLGTMQSAFSDGTNLRERAETKVGQVFDLGAFDMVVQSAGPVSSAGAYQSSSSTQVYAVTLKVTNTLRAPEKFGWQYANPTLVDASGKELSWSRDLIDSASGKSAGPELQPGQPYLLQYAFSAERGRTLKQFTLALNAGRTIVVDLR
jgi:hypothetical protein